MPRPIKQGLEYYPLNVDFLKDIKIRKIVRACGISAIPILLSLLGNIYSDDGYYLRWDQEEMPFLIADEIGVTEGQVIETVKKAVQVDFFNANMFRDYNILTSNGIQKRYFEAVKRRKSVCYDARFLFPNINVYINDDNVYINSINVDDNQQSKVKESKVKESKEGEAILFSSFFSIYPYHKNPSSKDKALKVWEELLDEGVVAEDIIAATKEYARATADMDPKYRKHPNNFLSGNYWLKYYKRAPLSTCEYCKGTGALTEEDQYGQLISKTCPCLHRYDVLEEE